MSTSTSSIIDLRSDTVTLPLPEMRRAMYEAELGDDVYGEDPTVNRLQEQSAAAMGTEAALFVSSGTMGNLVAVLAHCGRGDEIILGDQSHIFYYEGGGASVLGATAMRTVHNRTDGTIDPSAIRAAVRDTTNPHFPRTGLICLENTHNRRGGSVLDPAYMRRVREVADEAGVPLHLDGARIFNAAVCLGLPAREVARGADSVNFCFSKGLAAPVGSMLCGSRDFIERGRRWRKMVGGGLRQAGVLAAAASYALEHMIDRLADDHANAHALAEGLCAIRGVGLGQPRVQTNIVFADTADTGLDPRDLQQRLTAAGVLANNAGGHLFRFVTHYGIARADVDEALARVRRAVEGL